MTTHSAGITIAKGDGASPEVFTTIAGVQSMPPINVGKSVKDRTDMGDTVKDYGLGIAEPPSITLTLSWNASDTQQVALITEHNDGTKCNYKITCPDSPATTYTFKALVSGYTTPTAGVDDDLMADFTFQLCGNDDGKIVTQA